MMYRLGCMADHWLFRHLDAGGKQQIIGAVHRRAFDAGAALFREGDAVSALFLVTAGRLRLYKTQEGGREIVLGYLGPHDLYGEYGLFEDVRHAVSATWVEAGAICECRKSDFELMLAQSPLLAQAVIRAQGEKLREMTELWAGGVGSPVQERIAMVLGQLARKYGEHTAGGLRLNFRLTHEELGALVGASRVMVTNALGAMRKQGMLALDNDHHLVIPPAAIAEAEPAPVTTPRCPCFAAPAR